MLDSNGNTLLVEDRKVEILDEPVKVYNFQVEDFHTYHVGENCIWVHNANYDSAVKKLSKNSKIGRKTKGKTEQKVKSGGFNQANVDFDSVVEPTSVKEIKGDYVNGRTGILEDGSKITVRSGSSDGRPTLEIRKTNGRGIEIRYGE